MSTKSSIVWAEEAHFYRDLADNEEGFYLELRGDDLEYVATPKSITVRIPPHIWEVIRTAAKADLSLVGVTDEELLARVEKVVDERIAKYAEASTERGKGWESFIGSGVYGGADLPRSKQVKFGLKHFKAERKHQQRTAKRMKALSTRPDEKL